MPELQNPRTTSLHPLDIYRCLRLKLWDADLKRMITLREMMGAASTSRAPA
jgi:omega-6 fatty acid desaturase (delta-12 desaturase)